MGLSWDYFEIIMGLSVTKQCSELRNNSLKVVVPNGFNSFMLNPYAGDG